MGVPLPDSPVKDFAGIQRNFDRLAESVVPEAIAGTVNNAELADDAVDARVLRDDAVTNGNRAVTRNHIRDGAIDGSKLDPGLVFGNSSLGNDAVDARVLKDDAATDANRAVTRDHIRDAAINAAKIDPAVPLAKRFAADVGNGVLTSILVAHLLGTRDVVVQVRDNAAPYATIVEGGAVLTRAERTDTDHVTLVFAAAPAAAAYRIVVLA